MRSTTTITTKKRTTEVRGDRAVFRAGILPLACSLTWRRSCHDRCMSFQCQPTATQKTPTRTAMADTPSPYDVPDLADGAHDAPEVTHPHLSVKPAGPA